MAQNKNMIISASLAIVIVIAIGAYAYTTLYNPNQTPSEENNDTNPKGSEDQPINDTEQVMLTVKYLDKNHTFSISDFEKMNVVTGSGRYIKTKPLPDTVVLGDIHNYTGITIRTLLDELDITIENYQINVTASDGWTSTYSMNESMGLVDIYNESGNVINNESAMMIVAYKEDGSYYSEIDKDKVEDDAIGPFRIAFIEDDTPITSSSLWTKRVTTIKIVNLS